MGTKGKRRIDESNVIAIILVIIAVVFLFSYCRQIIGDVSENPNSSDPGELPKDPNIALDAQKAIEEARKEVELARQGMVESEANIRKLSEEIAELEKELERLDSEEKVR